MMKARELARRRYGSGVFLDDLTALSNRQLNVSEKLEFLNEMHDDLIKNREDLFFEKSQATIEPAEYEKQLTELVYRICHVNELIKDSESILKASNSME